MRNEFLYLECLIVPRKLHIYYQLNLASSTYGTAQFKLDTCMRVLVQLLEKFVTELASLLQAHGSWHTFDPRDELYAHEVRSSVVYFTCEQSRYV